MQAVPLKLEAVPFRHHSIVEIYEFHDKIAYIHFAFGFVLPEKYEIDKCTPSYVFSDMFSKDFSKHYQAYLEYYEQETFTASSATCYWEGNSFFLNTKYYESTSASIAKVIEIRDKELLEVCDAPAPLKRIYNDSKTYAFGDFTVRMASKFSMECQSLASGKTLWKLKLSAYLYTEIDENNGILYFGTAGNGGRFYGVSLADGSVLFSYNNGGTVRFAWYNDSILLADKKGKPVLLNSKDGSEIRQIDFGEFKFHADQYMIIKDDQLYAVASGTGVMYAVCVDLK